MADGVYWVGASVSSSDLFEGIWPIPDGVTLNSYVVKADKTAVIDLVRDWGGAPMYVLEAVQSLGIDVNVIDYIVLNHLEPDHTGWLEILHKITKAKVVTTQKGADLAKALYHISDNEIIVVKSGDKIDLGQGKTLVFEEIPNVHWPETMVTYETQSKILFSCDAFGSFGGLRGSIFDDENNEENHKYFMEETLRYYANIVGPFSQNVLNAIDKLKGLEIKMIAPSHGLIWRGNVERIIKRYVAYANYMKDYAEPEITVVWGTMYGNTEKMLRAILEGIGKESVTVHIFKVPETDVSYILGKAWKSAGLLIGMPTYEYKMFPPMKYVIDIFAQKRVMFKKVLRFGSFGWSGGAQKQFEEAVKTLKWDLLESLDFKGSPTAEELEKGVKMGQELAKLVKAIPKKCDF
jgi:anaerobic nitric oxide reductase flavorubredoxin